MTLSRSRAGPIVAIEVSTAFVVVIGRLRNIPAAQGSHFYGGSHAGHQISNLNLPFSGALLNRNEPTGMNHDRPDSDFERQCRAGWVTHDDDLCCP
jgi:hypothetical protein